MKPCIFCSIMEGQMSAQVVYQDEHVCAFLDHRPLFPGHVLIVPRRHAVTLGDLKHAEIQPFFTAVRVLSRSVPLALSAEGSFVANNNIVSQSVPHLHFHVIPRVKKDGLKGFFWPRVPYRDEAHSEQVRADLERATAQEDILDFWFERHEGQWFEQNAAFDEEIRQRYGALVERGLEGAFDEWAATARGSLALLILLDQFPRNLFRHTARSFVGDSQAQQICLNGLTQQQDEQLEPIQRSFFYLPLEHAEDAELQKKSLDCFTRLGLAQPLDYARRHADIISRFGRYPHRNEALGRSSSDEERDFLQQPGSSFW